MEEFPTSESAETTPTPESVEGKEQYLDFFEFQREIKSLFDGTKNIEKWYQETRKHRPSWPAKPKVFYKDKGWHGWAILLNKESSEPAPEGWVNKNTLAIKLGITPQTVSGVAEKYRQSNPDWFKKHLSPDHNIYEYISPELAEAITNEYKQFEPMPDGWVTVPDLAKKIDVSSATVRKLVEELRGAHPDEIQSFRKMPFGNVSQCIGPTLIKIIENRLANEPALEGWITKSSLAKKMHASQDTIDKVAENYRQSNPKWFESYKASSGTLVEHYSPDLTAIIEQTFASYERAPEGWMTPVELAEQAQVAKETIKLFLKKFKQDHSEWFGLFYRDGDGKQILYCSPELVKVIRENFPIMNEAPGGWITRNSLAKELGVSREVIENTANIALADHPEWERNFKHQHNASKRSFYAPELVSFIKDHKDRVSADLEKGGWATSIELSEILGLKREIIQNLAEKYRKDKLEWFRDMGKKTERYSPELVEEIKNEFEDISLQDFLSSGWKPEDRLIFRFFKEHEAVKALVDEYAQNNKYRIRSFGRSAETKRSNVNNDRKEYVLIHPEVYSELQIKLEELFNLEAPKAGEIQPKDLEEVFAVEGVPHHIFLKILNEYKKTHPEWFNRRKVENNYWEFCSSELVKEMRPKLLITSQDIAEGWLSESEISEKLNTSQDAISNLVSKRSYQTQTNWIKWSKSERYFAPELIEMMTPKIHRKNEKQKKIERNQQEKESLSLKEDFDNFLQEVSEGKTLQAQEFRKLHSVYGSVSIFDLLYKFRQEFTRLPTDYVNGGMAKYLGDFLSVRNSFQLKDIDALSLPYLSDKTLQDALFEVVRESCLSYYHKRKLEDVHVADAEIVADYMRLTREETIGFDNSELNEVIANVEEYFHSILNDFEKPTYIVDSLREGRPFPDLNQVLNIKEVFEKKKMLIGDEMGMGKSASAILSKEYLGSKQALVVVPSNVVATWQNYLSDKLSETGQQVGYFKQGMAPRVLTVEDPESLDGQDLTTFDYVLISQERMTEPYLERLQSVAGGSWDMLIVDEVHKLKNLEGGTRSKNILQLSESIEGPDKHLVLLSGTPVPNKIQDVAMILKLLYPEKFKDMRNSDLVSSIIRGDLVDLRNLLIPRMQMKALRESVEMPELTEKRMTTRLSQEEQDIYEILLDDDELTASEKIQVFRKFVMNPASIDVTPRVEGSKIHDVSEHIKQEFQTKNKIVMFVNGYIEGMIRGDNNIIEQLGLPPEIVVRVIEGEVDPEDRQAIQKELAETTEKTLLVVSGQTADVGVDFSAADSMLFYNDPWTKFDKQQQTARVYRPGLENDLTVTTSVVEGSIEQGIEEYIELKYDAIQKLLKGIPITDIEKNILRQSEKQRAADIEGDPEIAKEWLNSPQNRLHRFFGLTKEIGEKAFRKFLMQYDEDYAECYTNMGGRGFQANTARAVGTLIDNLSKESDQGNLDTKILDIASGPEMLKAHIGDQHKDQITSLDINPLHFQGDGEGRIAGSFLNLPIKGESFDYANLSLALHYSRFAPRRGEFERLEVLQEMNRVLKVGGRAVINLLFSLQFKDLEKFRKVAEGMGFGIVDQYTGEMYSGAQFQSFCVVLEKREDSKTDMAELVEVIGKENLEGLKFQESERQPYAGGSRIINSFSLNYQELPIVFNQADNSMFEEEQAIIQEGRELKQKYKTIRAIPREEIISHGFIKIFNGKSYRLLKKSEKIGGFVDVR